MHHPARRTKTAQRLREAVRRLIVTQGALEEAKRPCGTALPIPHAYALLELLHSDAPLTVAELAANLAIDRTNVSRLCIRMERNGELVRAAAPGDGRARALSLTAHGEQLARSVDNASLRHFTRVAEGLAGSATAVIEALKLLETAIAKTTTDGSTRGQDA